MFKEYRRGVCVCENNLDVIQGEVRKKVTRFCKCLRFSKSGFAIFSDFDGSPKLPALSSSDRQRVMVMETTTKVYINITVNFYTLVHVGRR